MLANLKQIREHIRHRGLGITIYDMKKLCIDNHMSRALADIESVENDYELMTRFFANGFDDPEREKLYSKLEQRLFNIVLGLIVDGIADQNPTFKQCQINALSMPFEYESIEETLSRYDQELTLASLEENAEEKQKDIHQRLLRYRIFLFNFIYTSKPWTQNESEIMDKVLLSPLVDVIDQQIILGAMLMSQRTVFDVWKFVTLCDVAAKTDSMYLSARALVGIVLGLPDDIDCQINGTLIDKSLESLFAVEGMKQKFVDVQSQLLICMETMQNEKTINKEIMPTLLKNGKEMMDRKESDEDKLDALLYPDKEEKNMEEMEASINKIRKMQQNGADVFFSSFSHAKRFSFFYTLMNWFCPFYIEHPQVATSNFKDLPIEFLKKITVGEAFCNSDKYSFILSLAHVINQIPKDMVKLMQSGEVVPAFTDNAQTNEALVRRSYLNDLYRFFNLYTDKNHFRSPFASDESVCFFLNDLITDNFYDTPYALRVSRQLWKHHCYKALDRMLDRYAIADDIEWLKLLALNNEHKKVYDQALRFFKMALEKVPGDKLLLSRTANAAFLATRYDDALDFYQQYIDLSTEEDDTDVEEFRMALCEFKTDNVEDGMKRLFRLSYNEPENVMYRKALAWGYMIEKKYPEAVQVYEAFAEKEIEPIDVLRKSIAQWMNHKNQDAVCTLRQYVELTNNGHIEPNADSKNANILDMMAEQLHELGLYRKYKTEAMILIDLALKDKLK